MDSSWSSRKGCPRYEASRVVGIVGVLVYDGDPESPVGVFALRHGTHCAARSVKSGRATGRVGARRRQGWGIGTTRFALRGCLGSRRRTHVFEGLPVKGQAGSMPGYPLVILILLCEAELAYHRPGVCLGLAATVLAVLGVCHARPAAAALIVHADVARNKGRLPTVFRVDSLGLGTQQSIR